MLKTLKELNIQPLNIKHPSIRAMNKTLFTFQQTPVSKSKANDIISEILELTTTNRPKEVDDIIARLKQYVSEFEWQMGDINIIQRMVNYSVAYWIKTKDVNNDEVIIQHLQRWKYIKTVIEESSFKSKLNIKSFSKLNKELLNVLEDRYK